MRPLLVRTAISVPVALGSLLLFTATSQDTYTEVAESEINESVPLDSSGSHRGTFSFTVSAASNSDLVGILEVRVIVTSEDARKSLDARQVGTEEWIRVRDAVYVYLNLADCEVSTGADDTGSAGCATNISSSNG